MYSVASRIFQILDYLCRELEGFFYRIWIEIHVNYHIKGTNSTNILWNKDIDWFLVEIMFQIIRMNSNLV